MKKEKGSPIEDNDGNLTFGWQGIGNGTTKHMDIMKSTDVTTAILLSPCPEDGVLVELRLLMGTLDFHKKKETGYFVHIYEQVPNDLPRNLASGVDAHLAQLTQAMSDKYDPDGGPLPLFNVGDLVTCSLPHQDVDSGNEQGPRTGYVLFRKYHMDQNYFRYHLKYTDGTSDKVPEFLLCAAEEEEKKQAEDACETLSAFKLISSTQIPHVRTSSTTAHAYSLRIPVQRGQYVGLHHRSGKLDMYYNGVWPRNEPNEFSYTFTRGLTLCCRTPGAVEYHNVHAGLSTWGFATTIRTNSMELHHPCLHVQQPDIRRLGTGHHRHSSTSSSGLNNYAYSSDDDDDDSLLYDTNFSDWTDEQD